MLEEPIGQARQTEENPFHRELFSSDTLGNLSNDAKNLGKDAMNLGKDAMDIGKDALKLVKDLGTAEVKGFNKVTGYLKSIAEQFEKYGDKLLMALKPQEQKDLNDSINKMGCPMAKLRAALSKSGADNATESSEQSQKKSL